jgi:hypothetical protein
MAQLSGGFWLRSGLARLRFQTAHGSACEAQVALQLAVAWSYVNELQTTAVLSAEKSLPILQFRLEEEPAND